MKKAVYVNEIIQSNAFRVKEHLENLKWEVIQSFYTVVPPFICGFIVWDGEEATLIRTKDSKDEHEGYDKAFEMTKSASKYAGLYDKMVDFGKAEVDTDNKVITCKRVDVRKSNKGKWKR